MIMLFNSITFLVFFLPLSLLVFYILGRFQMNAAKSWLIVVSFLFYVWWNPDFFIILVGSILFNYIFGHLIQTHQERPKMTSFILTIGILGNVALLFYFKYLLTLMKWFNAI